MLREFITIRREAFDKVESFQQRMNYLRQRLTTSPFKQSDEVYTWFALQGIAKEYPDLYNRSIVKIQDNKLTWNDLMVELRQLAVSEAAKPVMATVGVNKPENRTTTPAAASTTSTTADGKPKGPSKWIQCATCNKRVPKTAALHCNGCGSHHPGTCWKCEPEKAPEWWRLKQTTKTANDQTSTTGPLHQHSGVSNPDNTTDPAPRSILKKTNDGKRVLFQTTNLALNAIDIDLSSFQGGPQRI